MNKTKAIIAALVLAAIGALSGCGHSTFDVTGRLVLASESPGEWEEDESCSGSGGYDDIESGAQVIVYDNKDTKLATASLGEGVALTSMACRFTFTVHDVPAQDADLYGIEVTSRGQITFSQEQADDVGMTLG